MITRPGAALFAAVTATPLRRIAIGVAAGRNVPWCSSAARCEMCVYEEPAGIVRKQAGWTVIVHPPRLKR